MKYRSVNKITKDKAKIEFASNDQDRICIALLALVLHEEDYEYLLQVCTNYLDHNDIKVKATAIQSIGHLARLHRKMNKDLVVPKLKKLEKLHELYGIVKDAMDDISTYT